MKNTMPITAVARSSFQTAARPASLNRIAWARATKCVDGENIMILCTGTGMLSNGVLLPESRFMTMNSGIACSANCGMERARVARKIPSEVAAKR